MRNERDRGPDAKPMFGWRASSAVVFGLGLVALGLVAFGIWLTLRGDTQLWYGYFPIP